MFLTFALVSALATAPVDTIPDPDPVAGPVVLQPTRIGAPLGAAQAVAAPSVDDDTTPPRRRKAVQISDGYALRLKIHYLASYATIPIFAAQAIVGERLYNEELVGRPTPSLKTTHDAIAVALGGLFAVNTVTGAWNWWETRGQPQGRAWRTVHAALMLVADGGFAYTATLGSGAGYNRGTIAGRDLHRNWAIGSASVALVSYVMMWKPIRGDK
jgi:hypothetical protein